MVETSTLKLEVKRVNRRFDSRTGQFNDSEEEPATAAATAAKKTLDGGYAFSIIHQIIPPQPVVTTLCIRSPVFIDTAKVVMRTCRDIVWTSNPLQVRRICPPKCSYLHDTQLSPNQILVWLPRFKEHLASCEARSIEEAPRTEEEQQTIEHLSFFIRFLEEEFESTLAEVAAVLSEGKITFNLLWSLFLPGAIIVTNCSITGQPITARLISGTYVSQGSRTYHLKCEYVDYAQDVPCTVETMIGISYFEGTSVVTDLSAFPMDPFMPEESRVALRTKLVARGKRFAELSSAWCHKRYAGIAYRPASSGKIGV